MKEGRKPEYPEKTPDDQLHICIGVTVQCFTGLGKEQAMMNMRERGLCCIAPKQIAKYPRRRNVTTSMVGQTKQKTTNKQTKTVTCKNLTKNCEPQIYIAGNAEEGIGKLWE